MIQFNNALNAWGTAEFNDVLKQDSNTADMIFTLAEQIEQLSSRITLHPGDIIFSGTPEGVGPVKPGDTLDCWFQTIGHAQIKIHSAFV